MSEEVTARYIRQLEQQCAEYLAALAEARAQAERVQAEIDADLNMAIPCDCDPDDGAICLAHRVRAALVPAEKETSS